MKLVKMSLAAAMLMGASAYAEVNVKFDGQAKLIYQTTDRSDLGDNTGLFEQGDTPQVGGAAFGGAAAGGASLTLGASADVGAGLSLGAEIQAVSTLGLENNLVSSHMWSTADTGADVNGDGLDNDGVSVDSAWNATQVYIAKTMGNTTVKVGRQELDTPLLFTEKWNVAKNTFEAAVVVNSDIPNTTLVGAYVGKHNGAGQATPTGAANFGGNGRTVNVEDNLGGSAFTSFNDGAYAVAAVVNPMDNLTAQAWYYRVTRVADAYWLQADMKNIADMVSVGHNMHH
jgi:hypothetical protein